MNLSTVVGLAGTLLAFVCTIPQLRRLTRLRTAAGVSVAALANSTISGTAWTAYGVIHHDVWIALPALVSLPATGGALVLAWLRGGVRDRLWLPVAWLATLVGAAIATRWVGEGPITIVLGFSIALMVTPAAFTAWRSSDVSAVAASGWALLIMDASLAAAYGLLAGIEANLIYAAVAATGAGAILARIALPAEVHARMRRPLPVPPGPDDEGPDPVSRQDVDLAA